MGIVIGVDIGGTNIRIGAVDEQLNLSADFKLSQKLVLKGECPLEEFCNFVQRYLQENHEGKKIDALAVGVPAALSRDRSTVFNAPNIRGFDGVNIQERLQKKFPFPVLLEKDVTMLFYHDLYHQNISHQGVIIGCYVGTGLGNVISIHGKLLAGKDGTACELGHIPLWGQHDLCTCGNEGCAESHVAGKYLVELQQSTFPETPISELFVRHGESPEIETYLEKLALPIATEITILNPDKVILGGGIISMKSFPREKLERQLYRHTRKPLPAENLTLVYAEDTGKNGILGCALYARERLSGNRRELL